MRLLYVSGFGLLGVLSRYYIGLYTSQFDSPFPIGTFFVNLLGAFLIGVVYTVSVERNLLSEALRLGLIVGFLGGFTTFSSLCFEFVNLSQTGQVRTALFYLVSSTVLGIGGCIGGIWAARLVA